MSDWIPPLLEKLAAGRSVVRMAVASVKGSAPREPGATLLYWQDGDGRTRSLGTIGGGHLEARALEIAAHLLAAGAESRRVERFTLGASLGQCCGGVVELYWERFDDLAQASALADADFSATPLLRYCAMDGSGQEWLLQEDEVPGAGLPTPRFEQGAALLRLGETRYFVERLADEATPLWLFGAGHVGKALVRVLADLPFRITWVDSREDLLAEAMAGLQYPANVHSKWAEDPAEAAALAPVGAWHLLMTHSHEQDLAISAALLRADTFGFLGLIGSKTKEARFRHRLAAQGCSAAALARMVCPIGVGRIASKLPAAIAIGVAAQLLQERESRTVRLPTSRGVLSHE